MPIGSNNGQNCDGPNNSPAFSIQDEMIQSAGQVVEMDDAKGTHVNNMTNRTLVCHIVYGDYSKS
jgi:hypothetical protein